MIYDWAESVEELLMDYRSLLAEDKLNGFLTYIGNFLINPDEIMYIEAVEAENQDEELEDDTV